MPGGGRLRLRTGSTSFDDAFVRRNPWARAGSFAELAVADTGVGMDEATQARAFEPFFTTRPEGTGLGLATVYGIVQQHRGFVHLESSPRAGTTFRVYLPLATSESLPPPSLSPQPRDIGRGGRELILLAEDEPSLRALVVATLSSIGYRVIATGDGEEALGEFERRSGDISLVVLDVVMPRMDACTAYERMRAIRPDVRVLFVTGYAPESTRLGEILRGAHGHLLEKPFTPQTLSAKVRRILDEPRAP
jgi:CheY-like chemotaxis protein